jgi:inhibitor of cysteine peptidase
MNKAGIIILALVLLAAAVLTGCGTKVSAYTESSKSIDVAAGQEFTIALQSNPTTGYDWHPVVDEQYLTLVKKDYKQNDHTGKPLVGSGGTDYFVYKALKAGETNITFTYYRSWEKPVAENQQQVFNIRIK